MSHLLGQALAGEREEVAALIEKVESAPYRHLKSVVAKLGEAKPWEDIASTLLSLGREVIVEDAGRARDLARLALFAAGRVKSPEPLRESLLVEAECLFADALRRLGRLRSAERSFVRTARRMAHCEVRERAYFLVALSDLREAQERYEEALALRARAAHLYGALGEVDREAAALSSKAALEMARGETDETLSTLAEIIALIDRGVAASFAVGAAVSFAALLGERDSPKAIAILEKVRDRYPELAHSEEVAALEFLEGRLLTWGTRPDLAEARLTGAFLSFRDLGLVHDAALAALALAVLFIRSEREDVLLSSVEWSIGILLSRSLPEGLREVLTAFRDAVYAGQATITLAHAIMSYVEQLEVNPNEKFIPPAPRGGRGR